jgi:mannose-1-phosphate guanylyltransferase
MILAAGLGTRLQPLTNEKPKPLVPIGDRTALSFALATLRAAQCTRIAINTFHLSEGLEQFARSEQLALSPEPDLLGTAGGVRKALPQLGDGPIAIWNGDILATPDLSAGFEALEHHGWLAALFVREVAHGEGNVGFDRSGRIVRLRKESFGAEVASGEFSGIHVVAPGLRELLPMKGCMVSDVYLPLLARASESVERIGIVRVPAFRDVGTLESYAAANFAWLTEHGLENYTASTAQVHAKITRSIVGSGARVEAELRNCIVWPDTHVHSAHENSVVTPRGAVRFD